MSSADIAARAFATGPLQCVEPLGRGLINDTFLVTMRGEAPARAVLQRINPRVFPEPVRLMENLRTWLDHVSHRQSRESVMRFPEILTTRDGRDYFVDEQGGFWRALSYLEETVAIDTLGVPEAGEVGEALGQFHRLGSELDARRLHLTRPMFHVTPHYFERYRQARQSTTVHPDPALEECMAFAEARGAIVNAIEDERRAGRLPVRVVHGDPKLDNVLFDRHTRRAASLIDLDTVQPGILLYDLGDCLRSCANPAGESPADPSEARFDLALAQALLGRYLSAMQGRLHPNERQLLPLAIRMIPFELGLRFLTDHLEGDLYFKIERPGHNLWRARTQFHLVASIEQQSSEIDDLVNSPGH